MTPSAISKKIEIFKNAFETVIETMSFEIKETKYVLKRVKQGYFCVLFYNLNPVISFRFTHMEIDEKNERIYFFRKSIIVAEVPGIPDDFLKDGVNSKDFNL